MNKLENNYINNLWATKYVWSPDMDGFICKIFKTKKQILPVDEQRKLLENKKVYFWEYIPETEIVETENWEYIIRQKFINWKTLAQTNISNLSSESLSKLLDLIKKFLKYYKEQWWDMDITWYQHYPSNIGTIERKIKNFLTIYKNFLVSTNIMISDDWNVYIVDVCESAETHPPLRFKNFCAKPFIKVTIHNLEKLLQYKIQAEKEKINNELTNVLE